MTSDIQKTQTVRRVANHTPHFIILPPTETFVQGIKLIPGLNTVPVLYFTESEARVIKRAAYIDDVGREFPASVRKPSVEMWEQLQKHVELLDVNGARSYGPQVSVYDDIMVDRQDGPPPPTALPRSKEEAMLLISTTTEREALLRWKSMARGDINVALSARLQELGHA